MMELESRVVGPYLTALRAALVAHAPGDDWVSLRAADHHLAALMPSLGGDVLSPAEVHPSDGLPSNNWLSRARAEAILAQEDHGPVSEPHPVLGEDIVRRHAHRTALRAHLRNGALLPSSALTAHQRYAGAVSTYRVTFDHLTPGMGWMRIVVDLSGDFKASEGLFAHDADHEAARVDEGLKHLFSRHGATPLLVLLETLSNLLLVDVQRLSRTFVGPFWFPGLPRPEGAPEALDGALCLHLVQELVGVDVHKSAHRDPWVPPVVGVSAPEGMGLFRERRLAVPQGRVADVSAWANARGGAVVVGF